MRTAGDLRDVGDLVVAIAIVQRFEDVGTGDAQAASIELDTNLLVVVGEVAERAELAQPIAGFADLVEDLFPRRCAWHVGSIHAP